MNVSDLGTVSGLLLSAYGIGWGMGALFYAFKRALDFL